MDVLLSLVFRIKQELGIKNLFCVVYDVLFGCLGWIQGIIQVNVYIYVGMVKCCLVVVIEMFFRVVDIYDCDFMIFVDGVGVCIVEVVVGDKEEGIIGIEVGIWVEDEVYYFFLGKGNIKEVDFNVWYIKMYGCKIYEFVFIKVL